MLDRQTRSHELTGDLRADLRVGTAEAHRRLDAVIEALDVATRPGLLRFLRGSDVALGALSPTLAQTGLPDAAPLRAAIARDLQVLGGQGSVRFEAVRMTGDRAVGAYYVVAGSRLGAQVLARHHATAVDARVRAADAYLNAPAGLGMWQAFRYHLVELSSEMEAASVLDGAWAAFEIFSRAFAPVAAEGTADG